MKTKESLKNIIERKNFRTFWHCYEFLTTASYSPMEAFSASVEHFGLDKLFDNVAFIRVNEEMWIAHSVYSSHKTPPKIIIGVINENNQHLTEFYRIYNKRYNENDVSIQQDIESSCEIIQIVDITPFMMDFVIEKMHSHFKIDVSKKLNTKLKQALSKPNNLNQDIQALRDNIRRFDDLTIQPQRPYNPIPPREDNIRLLYPDNNGNNNRA